MLAVLAPIIVFGLVIFVHELGHFIAAKLTGVYAPRFSIGFGPALWRRRHGETEYVLAVLPLGGYVRMASRHDAEAAFIEGGNEETGALKPGDAGYDPEAMIPFGPKPVPENRWFESKSLAARLVIMFAGVTMNVVLAFAALSYVAIVYGEPYVATRVVGAVHPLTSAPMLSKILAGDTIVRVNGVAVASWSDIADRILATPPGAVTLATQRTEVRVPIGTAGAPSREDLINAVDFFMPPVIGDVASGSPAMRGGLEAGDTVSAIDHHPISSSSDLQERVTTAAGVPLRFEVRRGAQTIPLTITPESTTTKDPVTKARMVAGRIGVTFADITSRRPMGALASFRTGAEQTWRVAASIVGVVKGLITREVSVRQLGGPIAITRASVAAARSGLETLLTLIALLSVNVAVLNLLPIPILDGGQILINVAESAKGSPFTARTREYILRFGLVAILLIFVMTTFNDVVVGVKDVVARLFG
ncbi:MAG: RIP metalloprotease RseP [Gemmatimonadales bacterium]